MKFLKYILFIAVAAQISLIGCSKDKSSSAPPPPPKDPPTCTGTGCSGTPHTKSGSRWVGTFNLKNRGDFEDFLAQVGACNPYYYNWNPFYDFDDVYTNCDFMSQRATFTLEAVKNGTTTTGDGFLTVQLTTGARYTYNGYYTITNADMSFDSLFRVVTTTPANLASTTITVEIYFIDTLVATGVMRKF